MNILERFQEWWDENKEPLIVIVVVIGLATLAGFVVGHAIDVAKAKAVQDMNNCMDAGNSWIRVGQSQWVCYIRPFNRDEPGPTPTAQPSSNKA